MNRNAALCAVLEADGRTQEEIAVAAGVTPQALSNYKAGYTPTMRNALRLAKVLNCTVDSIFQSQEETEVVSDG